MNDGVYNIEIFWSGKWPCLCFGKWEIKINDILLDIPEDKKYEHMNTRGNYQSWHFTDDWDAEWEIYTDGLYFEDWIKDNDWLLKEIEDKVPNCKEDIMRLAESIYTYIQEYDFRPGSCGGCI